MLPANRSQITSLLLMLRLPSSRSLSSSLLRHGVQALWVSKTGKESVYMKPVLTSTDSHRRSLPASNPIPWGWHVHLPRTGCGTPYVLHYSAIKSHTNMVIGHCCYHPVHGQQGSRQSEVFRFLYLGRSLHSSFRLGVPIHPRDQGTSILPQA